MFTLDSKARKLLFSQEISDSLIFPLTSVGTGACPKKINCKKKQTYILSAQ